MTIKSAIGSLSFVAAAALIGITVAAPAKAQFKEQTIPAECLDEHGRFVLNGSNYAACAQYGRVDG